MAYYEQIGFQAGQAAVLEDLASVPEGVALWQSAHHTRSVRIVVHIIAPQQSDRALLARTIFSAGHHAEIYSDPLELISHRPSDGVVIIDDSTTGVSVDLLGAMADAGIWLPVIGFGKQLAYDTVIAGTKAGVADYYIGNFDQTALIAKLETAYLSGQVVLEARMRRAKARLLITGLSAREREVIDLLATGCSNKEMARILAISPRTVEIHRMKMMSKLCAKTSADAIRLRLEAFSTI